MRTLAVVSFYSLIDTFKDEFAKNMCAECSCCDLGRDINLEILRVEGYRKFCNKIFNATKFAMLKLDDKFVPEPTPKVRFEETLSRDEERQGSSC